LDKKTSHNTKRILFVTVIIIVITILFFFLVDILAVIRQLRAADLRFLIAASIMFIGGLVAFAVRWRALLGNKPGLLFTFHASNMGHAGNILIPFRAGEAIRILVMGTEKSISLTEATTSVVVERLFEQLMRLLTFGVAILVGVGLQLSLGAALGGIGFLALGFGAIAWLVSNQEFTLDKGSRLLARLPRVTEEKARKSISDLYPALVRDHLGLLLGLLLPDLALAGRCFSAPTASGCLTGRSGLVSAFRSYAARHLSRLNRRALGCHWH
jgi:uncharacterized protein (TIRG00374 family)